MKLYFRLLVLSCIILIFSAPISAMQKAPTSDVAQTAQRPEIIEAASNDDIKKVKSLIKKDRSIVNKTDERDVNALMIACDRGNEPMVQLLLKYKANVNHKAAHAMNRTALHQAGVRGSAKIIKLLLEHGALVNAQDAHGYTPLLRVALNGDPSACEMLLANGADVNAANMQGCTPLMAAAHNGHDQVCQLLIEHKAQVNIQDSRGATPLQFALRLKRESTTRLLISHGADVNCTDQQGLTPLMVAVSRSALCQLLLEQKDLKLDAKHKSGLTALAMAVGTCNVETSQMLLKAGADIGNVLSKDVLARLEAGIEFQEVDQHGKPKGFQIKIHKQTPAQVMDFLVSRCGAKKLVSDYLNRASDEDMAYVLKFMLERGVDVNASMSHDGKTMLFQAAKKGHIKSVLQLLLKNADTNKARSDGATPLMAAAHGGHADIVKLLLQRGAQVNTVAENMHNATALCIALNGGHTECAKLLIEKGADVNARVEKGWTALMYAAHLGSEELAHLLFHCGADRDARSDAGNTAADIAKKQNNESILALLDAAEKSGSK